MACVKSCQLIWLLQRCRKPRSVSWCHRRWLHLHTYPLRQRFNELHIQMLSESLHKQVFAGQKLQTAAEQKEGVWQSPVQASGSSRGAKDLEVEQIKAHLNRFGLLAGTAQSIPDVQLNLPPLLGGSVDEHFRRIAEDQIKDYKTMADKIAQVKAPRFPKQWVKQKGWTKYNSDGTWERVAFPNEDVLVFDIECLVPEGSFPTMATAMSPSHWYSWTADCVLKDKVRWTQDKHLCDLIPLESKSSTGSGSMKTKGARRLVIGHNVGFDRSFVKEQYLIQGGRMRFMDTMSMHIAVCGQTSFQRILYQSADGKSSRKEVREHSQRQKMFNMAASAEWMKVSGMNNLDAVHQLHCGAKPLRKELRNVFLEGTMADVRNDYQKLMTYCAHDVLATHSVFAKLWPEFLKRFPHPVTLGGMLEMGTAYLPVDSRWPRYLDNAAFEYQESQRELNKLLIALANQACSFLHDDAYKDDPWLWDLDWSVAKVKLNKMRRPPSPLSVQEAASLREDYLNEDKMDLNTYLEDKAGREERLAVIQKVMDTRDYLPKKPGFLIGYPLWYRKLCPRLQDENYAPGPSLISTQSRVTPKLMRLTWDGYPLHYDDQLGWGYLVPNRVQESELEQELDSQDPDKAEQESPFPLRAFLDFMRQSKPELFHKEAGPKSTGPEAGGESWHYLTPQNFDQKALSPEEVVKHWDTSKPSTSGDKTTSPHLGEGPHDIGLPGCLFYMIPHKDGKGKRVGNPLAKDYLHRVEDGMLRSESGDHATRAMQLSQRCSYWKNNQDRIQGQMVSWMTKGQLPKCVTQHEDYQEYGQYGAIVPRIAVAGTITRRAVEPTWLTASNAYPDRIGSELKAMIHSPPGYHFVGADVDSQELWIAAVLGDAHFKKIHGCTALGWMTLQGSKADRTDLHSKTAQLANVTRDQAKVLNYGRIYGAGQAFAEQLLMQFNPSISPYQARTAAKKMFKMTKGERSRDGLWGGGSESFMFNALERIANSEEPTTPVLGARISKALEPKYVLDDFKTSRVNWVVQSSAVDYLHLMLVCMRWLIDTYHIDARFCISIHDEVRFLVASPDRYRAALALQITNLLTRAMFAQRLGMPDLPQTVAFFSAVDIDYCLRKEVTLDCRTPSNIHGLAQGYAIPQGEALDIHEIIKRTNGRLSKD